MEHIESLSGRGLRVPSRADATWRRKPLARAGLHRVISQRAVIVEGSRALPPRIQNDALFHSYDFGCRETPKTTIELCQRFPGVVRFVPLNELIDTP
jgi:hypothetical protein